MRFVYCGESFRVALIELFKEALDSPEEKTASGKVLHIGADMNGIQPGKGGVDIMQLGKPTGDFIIDQFSQAFFPDLLFEAPKSAEAKVNGIV
jgi:hypothetical protein